MGLVNQVEAVGRDLSRLHLIVCWVCGLCNGLGVTKLKEKLQIGSAV